MPTKQELMDWMRKYKAQHCKAISKMKKDELYAEAKKHGYLHHKYGIEKKTENKSTPAPTPAKKKTEKTAIFMTRKEIFQKIRELDKVDMVKINESEARKVAQKRKKLFEMLKSVQSA